MRWICKDEIEDELSQTWRDAAAAALINLSDAASQNARTTILSSAAAAKIWRDYLALVPENLKRKCWYCEAEEIRSDMPVDHFRPKGKVEDVAGHDGYWWLAFDWENYRCACTYCNSRRVFQETAGGKACRFPLMDPTTRAYKPADDLTLERPDFLDPFDPDDFKLLWFDGDGMPIPTTSCPEVLKTKVSNSISIFHLNEKRISRKRNQLRLDIKRQIDLLEKGSASEIRAAKSYLRKITRDTQMLSRTACVYLSNYRYLPAVEEILNTD